MDDRIIPFREAALRGYRIEFTAERMQRCEAWLVVARVSYDDVQGELHNARMSDDPEETADQMIEEIDAEYR